MPRPQVAHIQLNILEVLKLQPRTQEVVSALNQLNSNLMDITQLYEHFAEKFNLAECKLSIVHCAGHYDPTLIESLWRDIVDNGRGTRTQQEIVESPIMDTLK